MPKIYHAKFPLGVLRLLYGKLPEMIYRVGKTKAKRDRLDPDIETQGRAYKFDYPIEEMFTQEITSISRIK
jgi:hypothetical protein